MLTQRKKSQCQFVSQSVLLQSVSPSLSQRGRQLDCQFIYLGNLLFHVIHQDVRLLVTRHKRGNTKKVLLRTLILNLLEIFTNLDSDTLEYFFDAYFPMPRQLTLDSSITEFSKDSTCIIRCIGWVHKIAENIPSLSKHLK